MFSLVSSDGAQGVAAARVTVRRRTVRRRKDPTGAFPRAEGTKGSAGIYLKVPKIRRSAPSRGFCMYGTAGEGLGMLAQETPSSLLAEWVLNPPLGAQSSPVTLVPLPPTPLHPIVLRGSARSFCSASTKAPVPAQQIARLGRCAAVPHAFQINVIILPLPPLLSTPALAHMTLLMTSKSRPAKSIHVFKLTSCDIFGGGWNLAVG